MEVKYDTIYVVGVYLMNIFKILILILASAANATIIYDTGIASPYQGKSTHDYADFYSYYAQSFEAPDDWLLDLSIPVYDNQNNESKNNPEFTIELWDSGLNLMASSPVYDAPKNDKADPIYYLLGGPDIELIAGDIYWAVYNPLSSDKEEAWCGFYLGSYNPCSGCYSCQYFEPTNTMVSSVTLFAYTAEFDSVPSPEPMTIMLLGLGGLFLKGR